MRQVRMMDLVGVCKLNRRQVGLADLQERDERDDRAEEDPARRRRARRSSCRDI